MMMMMIKYLSHPSKPARQVRNCLWHSIPHTTTPPPGTASSARSLYIVPSQRFWLQSLQPQQHRLQYRRTLLDVISTTTTNDGDGDDDGIITRHPDDNSAVTISTPAPPVPPVPPLTPTGRNSSNSSNSNTNRRIWDREAVADLFSQYAKVYDGTSCLNCDDIRSLLRGIGVVPAATTISKLFSVADNDNNGLIDLEEFLDHADMFLGDNPARIILIVGGPGSGKGLLSKRLMAECNVVHLSSGDLLRQEVALQTNLGRTVRDIMSRGELVSSAIMVALMKKRMKDHPGKRVLLDGFPRSIENAHDLVTLCGQPELALHLNCDDTILMERIMGRGASSENTPQQVRREDDNFQSALQRLRTFHKYHHSTMEWLQEQHVPIVNLDCSGSAESVWQQLVAIGRLMRPAVKIPIATGIAIPTTKENSMVTTTIAPTPPSPMESRQ